MVWTDTQSVFEETKKLESNITLHPWQVFVKNKDIKGPTLLYHMAEIEIDSAYLRFEKFISVKNDIRISHASRHWRLLFTNNRCLLQSHSTSVLKHWDPFCLYYSNSAIAASHLCSKPLTLFKSGHQDKHQGQWAASAGDKSNVPRGAYHQSKLLQAQQERSSPFSLPTARWTGVIEYKQLSAWETRIPGLTPTLARHLIHISIHNAHDQPTRVIRS